MRGRERREGEEGEEEEVERERVQVLLVIYTRKRNGGVKALLVIPGNEMEGLKQKWSIIICCHRDPILQCSQIFRGAVFIIKIGWGGINSRHPFLS